MPTFNVNGRPLLSFLTNSDRVIATLKTLHYGSLMTTQEFQSALPIKGRLRDIAGLGEYCTIVRGKRLWGNAKTIKALKRKMSQEQ